MSKSIASPLGWALGAVLLLGGVQAAQAETIYKYRGPDGVIMYSTTKPKDTPLIAEMDSAAMSGDERNLYHAQVVPPRVVAEADAHAQRVEQADANVRRAQRNLQDAQTALDQGREPLPGERSGTRSGFSRLNDAYNQRIAALQNAVALAQQQLDEAYRARSSS